MCWIFGWPFPFRLRQRNEKTYWLAGYAAVQHIALAGCQVVMTIQVGLRGLYVYVN
jgi:hypothetical protein